MAVVNYVFGKYEKNLMVQLKDFELDFLVSQARQLFRISQQQPVVLGLEKEGINDTLLIRNTQLEEVMQQTLGM